MPTVDPSFGQSPGVDVVLTSNLDDSEAEVLTAWPGTDDVAVLLVATFKDEKLQTFWPRFRRKGGTFQVFLPGCTEGNDPMASRVVPNKTTSARRSRHGMRHRQPLRGRTNNEVLRSARVIGQHGRRTRRPGKEVAYASCSGPSFRCVCKQQEEKSLPWPCRV